MFWSEKNFDDLLKWASWYKEQAVGLWCRIFCHNCLKNTLLDPCHLKKNIASLFATWCALTSLCFPCFSLMYPTVQPGFCCFPPKAMSSMPLFPTTLVPSNTTLFSWKNPVNLTPTFTWFQFHKYLWRFSHMLCIGDIKLTKTVFFRGTISIREAGIQTLSNNFCVAGLGVENTVTNKADSYASCPPWSICSSGGDGNQILKIDLQEALWREETSTDLRKQVAWKGRKFDSRQRGKSRLASLEEVTFLKKTFKQVITVKYNKG